MHYALIVFTIVSFLVAYKQYDKSTLSHTYQLSTPSWPPATARGTGATHSLPTESLTIWLYN
jgi:hypothetical protein